MSSSPSVLHPNHRLFASASPSLFVIEDPEKGAGLVAIAIVVAISISIVVVTITSFSTSKTQRKKSWCLALEDVLDPFRSSLAPTTVEALVCAQNWLRLKPLSSGNGYDAETVDDPESYRLESEITLKNIDILLEED
ncbi:uncharacterized protein LOC133851951 isoform X2 [Alnus glutinosa]|uniref:uncharacterized protein LOC133851951 isoform X2 n=1 Tax=Alnus glutinosa TaxID=3517 RepID=UPI002D766E24|nr:uncharacterized protein LOC133851951 isoform X2 [Alnus glutinosa]